MVSSDEDCGKSRRPGAEDSGSAGFHVKMTLFSKRNLMSVSSYLGSMLFPT
jgi:hypothetical protein